MKLDPITEYILNEQPIAHIPKEGFAAYAPLAKSLEAAFPRYKELGLDPTKFAKGIYNGSLDISLLHKLLEKYFTWGYQLGMQAAKTTTTVATSTPEAGAGGTAAAWLFIIASVYLYRRYLSKAARACKHTRGKQRTYCIAKYRYKGNEERIKELEKAMSSSKFTKNPEKFKSKLQDKIYKLKAKSLKIKKKLV